jgi:hypothetical protein
MRRKYALRQYGITLDDYNRLYAAQHGQCAVCGVHKEPWVPAGIAAGANISSSITSIRQDEFVAYFAATATSPLASRTTIRRFCARRRRISSALLTT